MDELDIQDGSNDKAYFTMVPNIVLNHSSAIDQALYMQMKRFAGEKRGGGNCSASHRTLMGKLKIGPKALKTSIQYLTDHRWIENVGSRKVMTEGGAQEVQIYKVNDIWRLNVEHYKGADESAPLSKGGDERKQGADERSQGGDESAPTKNIVELEENTASLRSDSLEVVEVPEEDARPKKQRDTQLEKAALYWMKKCEDGAGQVPTGGLAKIRAIIKRARTSLSLPQIKEMMDDWFETESQEPHEMIQITRCLSSFRVDKYLSENL